MATITRALSTRLRSGSAYKTTQKIGEAIMIELRYIGYTILIFLVLGFTISLLPIKKDKKNDPGAGE